MNLFTPKNILSLTETQELLYAYTGCPPVAYGTHTKAVLENIRRPYEYYFKQRNVSEALKVKSGNKELNEINVEEASSGFHYDSVVEFSKMFFEKYRGAFGVLQRWLGSTLQTMKYADLAKGRQTWSFIRKKNIPAAAALEETIEYLELNLGRKIGSSMVSYLQAILDVLEKEETFFEYEVTMNQKKQYQSDNESDEESHTIMRKVKFTQEELWNQMRKLNTMWKHLERGRLNRRTIATPSMLIRGFVKIVEDASRVLLEHIESAGVPVGGEEKLAKLASKLMGDKSKVTGELSGDQEKFNECLDPDAMRLMWEVFLKRCERPKWEQELFSIPFLVFKGKIADMGEGLTYNCKGYIEHRKLGELKSEFDELIPAIVFERKKNGEGIENVPVGIECTLGMFMGMYNLSSTLLSLIAADRPELEGNHVESSDDFIHFFYTETHDQMFEQAEMLRLSQKLVGINFSASKCILISPAGIGEFNSKYHYKEFVGNIATELPALFPNGLNPMSDLSMGLNVIRHSMNTNQMNMLTGDLALRLFLKAYRYAYLVEGITRRTKFMEENQIKPLLLNQGAKNVHSVSTLHLDEISLRKHLGLLTNEHLKKILNPANPFTAMGDSAIVYRQENKIPELLEDPSLGSIFKFEFTRNRTVLNREDRSILKKEKKYKELTNMINNCYPELMIANIDIPGTVSEAIESRLKQIVEQANITEDQKEHLRSMLEE